MNRPNRPQSSPNRPRDGSRSFVPASPPKGDGTNRWSGSGESGYGTISPSGTNQVLGVTPISVLASSRYGSLTRGALRDALWLRTGLSRADADLVVDAYLESRILVEADGLVMVRQ